MTGSIFKLKSLPPSHRYVIARASFHSHTYTHVLRHADNTCHTCAALFALRAGAKICLFSVYAYTWRGVYGPLRGCSPSLSCLQIGGRLKLSPGVPGEKIPVVVGIENSRKNLLFPLFLFFSMDEGEKEGEGQG